MVCGIPIELGNRLLVQKHFPVEILERKLCPLYKKRNSYSVKNLTFSEIDDSKSVSSAIRKNEKPCNMYDIHILIFPILDLSFVSDCPTKS